MALEVNPRQQKSRISQEPRCWHRTPQNPTFDAKCIFQLMKHTAWKNLVDFVKDALKKIVPSSNIANPKQSLLSRRSFCSGKAFTHPGGLLDANPEKGENK